MPNGQDRHCVVIYAVQNHIPAVAEVDQPFAKGRIKIVNGAAEPGLANQHINAGANRLNRAPCCGSILVGEKTV
jgi:hypothetical protein